MYISQKILDITGHSDYIVDDIGFSDSDVLIFDNSVLKIGPVSPEKHDEHAVLKYFEDILPVPKSLCCIEENGKCYMLMSKIEGEMSCYDRYMKKQYDLFRELAFALHLMWKINPYGCPFINSLDSKLSEARYRVEHGLVDVDDAEPDTFGENGFKDPEELLTWLYDNRPEEDLVISHGDFCLPNIFLKDGKFSGFVDVGKMGVADRWQDIALCYRSLKHNFSGYYGGKSFFPFDENAFFAAVGLEPDWKKIRYYILLDELF